jgi:hypothetical protein
MRGSPAAIANSLVHQQIAGVLNPDQYHADSVRRIAAASSLL